MYTREETGYHDVAQGSLDITVLLPRPPLSSEIRGMCHNQLHLDVLSGGISMGLSSFN